MIKVLTWHVHGSYLYYLTQTECEFYLPTKDDKSEGYGGRSGTIPWGDNVHEVKAEDVKNIKVDCVLFQSNKNYLEDQYEILSSQQRALPKIFLEHNPPREVPTDTKHIVNDPNIFLVHVTHFNNLMWDNNSTPSTVIEHGVIVPPGVKYTGEIPKGVVVVNGMPRRNRRTGLDILKKLQQQIPLDLIGMDSKEVGGIGEIPLTDLHAYISKYRFFFNPIRYTSLGLAVCEAMMIGMPIIGLATTEMPIIIQNNVTGFVHTDVNCIAQKMQQLIDDPQQAKELSQNAYHYANEKFSIHRFKSDWLQLFTKATRHSNQLTKEVV